MHPPDRRGHLLPGSLLTTSLLLPSLSGFRIGLYHPIKDSQALAVLSGESQMLRQVLAGGLSGTLAASAFTPLELIKVRSRPTAAAHPSEPRTPYL